MCHNEATSGIPDFTNFEALKELTTQDEGATFASLTRVSHIHLFGISFIFMFMFVGLIFSFAETSTNKYKCIAIGMPYIFLVVDILSWWLTKLHPMFALLVMVAGGGMAVAFAFMWSISILEMWVFNKVFLNAQGEKRPLLSEIIEGKLHQMGCPDATTIVNKLWCFTKSSSLFIWSKWLEIGLPFIKGIFKKKDLADSTPKCN